MNIAVYTLTRDRLPYTKLCFDAIKMKAGTSFRHFVIDNGSEDGTQFWIDKEYKPFYQRLLTRNWGISAASNSALDAIFTEIPDVDVIFKIDNDCMPITDEFLIKTAETVMAAGQFGAKYVLSPRVEGIVNQPKRGRERGLGGLKIGLTAIVGGLCHAVPASVYREYRYPTTLPMAAGQDDHFCNWVKQRGGEVGYIEDLAVEHYETTDGQCKRFPDYFKRKWDEEKKVVK